MKSFAEFESAVVASLHQERSDLQGLQSASEAQLSAWIEHLFRQFLGYDHWKEITREGSAPVGSKGSKQLFPDLRIEVQDNGLIFVECKRLGRLDGPRGQDELNDAVNQLKTYIRAHVDQAGIKPKTVLGVVTDGNRWLLMGLNKSNEFHTIADWTFLTDDPRLIAQRLWLLAKPALAQPTSALVEFLARRTLAGVLKENAKWLTKKVNEKLPDGTISEETISKWLRDAFSDPVQTPRSIVIDAHPADGSPVPQPSLQADLKLLTPKHTSVGNLTDTEGGRTRIIDLLKTEFLTTTDILVVEGPDGRRQSATLSADGKIHVAGQIFESVSPAALRALELTGKSLRAVNGWAVFRVLRSGNQLGTLLQIRSQYEGRDHIESPDGETVHSDEVTTPSAGEPDPAVAAALNQLEPLLKLLPELTTKATKSVSIYAGKLLVGYAYPRKRGLPRVRVFVGQNCPEWGTPDPTYEAWCFVDDWIENLEEVVELFKEASRLRLEEMTAGRDAYRRRLQSPESSAPRSA